MPETRVLREKRPGDSRYLAATLSETGLRLEGHDLGDGVAAVYGPDIREYEWAVDVATKDLPALRKLLGGSMLAPLLDVLERAGAVAVNKAVREVPHTVVWSRLGDWFVVASRRLGVRLHLPNLCG